jgi:hypothetical protein
VIPTKRHEREVFRIALVALLAVLARSQHSGPGPEVYIPHGTSFGGNIRVGYRANLVLYEAELLPLRHAA